jgi:hypothetical protein
MRLEQDRARGVLFAEAVISLWQTRGASEVAGLAKMQPPPCCGAAVVTDMVFALGGPEVNV